MIQPETLAQVRLALVKNSEQIRKKISHDEMFDPLICLHNGVLQLQDLVEVLWAGRPVTVLLVC